MTCVQKQKKNLYKYTKNALLLTRIYLLEIECEHKHLALSAIDRPSEDELSLVCEVGTVFLYDVGKSPAELQLRNEFEEWQVEVAAKSYFKIAVGSLEKNLLLLLHGEVINRVDSSHHVWAVVVEALGRILHVNRHRDVG